MNKILLLNKIQKSLLIRSVDGGEPSTDELY